MSYWEIAALSDVYLEDSYVLAIHEDNDKLIFDMEVVLTEKHPLYQSPSEGEQYCYIRANLCFSGIVYIEWLCRNSSQFLDASNEADYGNIDVFAKDGDLYTLSGDWGNVKIRCLTIDLIPRWVA